MMGTLHFVTALFELPAVGGKHHRTIDGILANAGFVFQQANLGRHVDIFCDVASFERLKAFAVAHRSEYDFDNVHMHVCTPIVVDKDDFNLVLQANDNPVKVHHHYVELMRRKYKFVQEVLSYAEPARASRTHLAWIDLGITHVATLPPPDVDIFLDLPRTLRVHMLRYFDLRETTAPDYLHHVQGHLAGGLVVGTRATMEALAIAFDAADRDARANKRAVLDEGLLSKVVMESMGRNVEYSVGDYRDMLVNYDTLRVAKHVAWMIEDARARHRSIELVQRVAMRGVAYAPGLITDAWISEQRDEAGMHDVISVDISKATQRPEAPVGGGLLGLVMIVKNEAKGLAKTLVSLRSHINKWTILDTGSTDGTQDVIRRELAAIPGTLHEEPFVDFATSRNRALELHARGQRPTQFTLMPDADDLLEHGHALRAFLAHHDRINGTEPGFMMHMRRGTLDYWLPIVLRTAAKARYRGAVHEYVDAAIGTKLPPQIVLRQDEGNIASSQRRWRRDLELLAMERKADPKNARAVFYLAQTLEQLGEKHEALAAYNDRIAMPGFDEEAVEARLRAAKIMDDSAYPWPTVMNAYLEAFAADPARAEPLYQIAKRYSKDDRHALAYVFAERAARMPIPDRRMMLDHDAYAFDAARIAGIHGYYMTDPAQRTRARELAESVVRKFPKHEQFRSNWMWYAPNVATMFAGASTRAIDFTPPAGWHASNPSIMLCAHDRSALRPQFQFLCIVRTTNYQIVNGQYLTPDDNVIYTRNWMVELDDHFKQMRAVEIVESKSVKEAWPRSSYPVHGFEDCRLFVDRQGQLMASATVCDFDTTRPADGPREIVHLRLGDRVLDHTNPQPYGILAAVPLRGAWSARAQKNWMPLAVQRDPKKSAEFVYAAQGDHGKPTVISTPFNGVAPVREIELGYGRLRGGSQVIAMRGGTWLAIVHDVSWPGNNARMYWHRFVEFDAEITKITRMSDPFYFEKKGIEFCCGLAHDIERNLLIASYSVDDSCAKLAVIPASSVLNSLRDDFVI